MSSHSTATKVAAAADWCVEKLNNMDSEKSFEEMKRAKRLLLDMWSVQDSDRPKTSGSLCNYFKNGPFTIPTLLAYSRYASSSGGCGEGGSGGSEARRGAPADAAIAAPAAQKRRRPR